MDAVVSASAFDNKPRVRGNRYFLTTDEIVSDETSRLFDHLPCRTTTPLLFLRIRCTIYMYCTICCNRSDYYPCRLSCIVEYIITPVDIIVHIRYNRNNNNNNNVLDKCFQLLFPFWFPPPPRS